MIFEFKATFYYCISFSVQFSIVSNRHAHLIFFSNECGKLVWKIGAVSINSSSSPININWVSPPCTPHATSVENPVIAAQFSCEGALLSGVEFDLQSPGYRLSLYKKKVQTGSILALSFLHILTERKNEY